MSKESAPFDEFEKTKDFVNAVYEEAYDEEDEVSEENLDRSLPHSISEGKFYQANFDRVKMKAGETIPLVMMSTDKEERPKSGDKASKRRPNASLLYTFASEKDPNEKYQSLQDIGDLYGVTRAMLSLDNKKALLNLHSISNKNTQDEFPLSEIETNRPLTVGIRMGASRAQNSKSIKIVEDVESGMSTEDLSEKYGSIAVTRARKTIEGWGLPAPERIRRDFRPVVEEIRNPETSMERLCELMQEFNNTSSYDGYSRGGNPVLTSVSELQMEAWGNKNRRNTKIAYKMLEEAGIPVNSVPNLVTKNGEKTLVGTYRFTLVRTRDEALEILKKTDDPALKYKPVTHLAGPEVDSLPNTNVIFGTQKGEYINALGLAFKRLGVSLGRMRITDRVIAGDCPINVFLYPNPKGRTLYIAREDSDEFVDYVERRLQALGIKY